MLSLNQKRIMNTLIKEKPSKLDPFEETLFVMDAAKNTLAEMQQWLHQSRLSRESRKAKSPSRKGSWPSVRLRRGKMRSIKLIRNESLPEKLEMDGQEGFWIGSSVTLAAQVSRCFTSVHALSTIKTEKIL